MSDDNGSRKSIMINTDFLKTPKKGRPRKSSPTETDEYGARKPAAARVTQRRRAGSSTPLEGLASLMDSTSPSKMRETLLRRIKQHQRQVQQEELAKLQQKNAGLMASGGDYSVSTPSRTPQQIRTALTPAQQTAYSKLNISPSVRTMSASTGDFSTFKDSVSYLDEIARRRNIEQQQLKAATAPPKTIPTIAAGRATTPSAIHAGEPLYGNLRGGMKPTYRTLKNRPQFTQPPAPLSPAVGGAGAVTVAGMGAGMPAMATAPAVPVRNHTIKQFYQQIGRGGIQPDRSNFGEPIQLSGAVRQPPPPATSTPLIAPLIAPPIDRHTRLEQLRQTRSQLPVTAPVPVPASSAAPIVISVPPSSPQPPQNHTFLLKNPYEHVPPPPHSPSSPIHLHSPHQINSHTIIELNKVERPSMEMFSTTPPPSEAGGAGSEEYEPQLVSPTPPPMAGDSLPLLPEPDLHIPQSATPHLDKRFRKYRVKTRRRIYKLGKDPTGSKVSVLIKNNHTRKNIQGQIMELNKVSMHDVKKYLRERNLLKVGSEAPDDILRETFEAVKLAGEIQNLNGDVFLHNYLNKADDEEDD